MTKMPEIPTKIKVDSLFEELEQLTRFLEETKEQGVAIHETEKHIFQSLLNMGIKLLDEYIKSCGKGDEEGQEVWINGCINEPLRKYAQLCLLKRPKSTKNVPAPSPNRFEPHYDVMTTPCKVLMMRSLLG